MNSQALVVENLHKVFFKSKGGFLGQVFGKRQAGDGDRIAAVDGVSFSVERGEVFGLLGPNGAGKTTTIKIISTLLRPTSGRVLVHGMDVDQHVQRVLSLIGTVLSGERCVYWKLTGRENLEYFGALYGLKGPGLQTRIDELLRRFELSKRADETVEKYSTGMKRRIALARAMLHDPEILILDEPTAGLDPQGARNLREMILELQDEGKTVLLTTHYMEEADYLSDRVAIIDHGRIIAMDSPEHLKQGLQQTRVIKLDAREWEDEVANSLQAAGLISAYTVTHDPSDRLWRAVIHLPRGVSVGSMMAAYLERGNNVLNVAVQEPTLEDVFINLTGKSLRD